GIGRVLEQLGEPGRLAQIVAEHAQAGAQGVEILEELVHHPQPRHIALRRGGETRGERGGTGDEEPTGAHGFTLSVRSPRKCGRHGGYAVNRWRDHRMMRTSTEIV